jgi:valyl-tRNA synthetase
MRHPVDHHPAKKEAKRLEKEAKLAAKAAKAVASIPAGEKKAKEKVAKEEVAPFVNTTPKGQKKGEFVRRIYA